MRRLTLPLLAALGLVLTVSSAQAAPGKSSDPHLVVGRATAPLGLLSGPDVSSNNVDGHSIIRWGSVAGSGRGFAVVKATEGTTYTNPYFKRDWSGAKAAGITRAAYHFARPTLPLSSAAAQARKFVATVGGVRDGVTLPLVLDMEQQGRLSPLQLQAWTRSFLLTTEQLTGRTPIVYTYYYFWQHQMGGATDFTRYPLWIASYTKTSPRPLPGGWSQWTLWQYTDRGHVPGVNGIVDLSVFCCSPDALAALANPVDAIAERYAALGGALGTLGPPTSPERSVGSGRFRDFTAGSIYWTKATGAHVLTGATWARYRGLGGPASVLGWPLSDTVPSEVGPDGATYAVFRGGRLYAGPADPIALLLTAGPLLDDWLQRGSIASPLGFPLTDPRPVAGGTQGIFTGGQLLSSTERGTHELHGQVLAQWLAAGGPDSAYGLPSSDVQVVPGGEQAQFGQLTIVASTAPSAG